MRVSPGASCWWIAVLLGALPACAPARAPTTRLHDPAEVEFSDVPDLYMNAAMKPCAELVAAYGNVAIAGELTVQGVSDGGSISTRLWLGADFDAGGLRLEPVQAWPPAFVFITNRLGDDPNSAIQTDASLILPRAGGAIQQGRSRDLLHGLIGVPLSTSELVSVITSCPMLNGSFIGHALGPAMFRVILDGPVPSEMIVARDSGVPEEWTLLRMGRSVPGRTWHWRADYGRRVLAVFRDFRIRSQEWNGILGSTFDVRFSWRRIQIGSALDKQLFVPEAPSQRPAFVR
jgi:hypothetical protein